MAHEFYRLETMELLKRARAYLGGKDLDFEDSDALWRALLKKNEIGMARRVLQDLREDRDKLRNVPLDLRAKLCQQHALLTSKDPELGVATRHDLALDIIKDQFDLQAPATDLKQSETLGIAGGICKRRWLDLGRLEDLKLAAELYTRGAAGPLGEDAYPQINAAFLHDVLTSIGESTSLSTAQVTELRKRVAEELPESDTWWNAASRAEAFFGLSDYEAATRALNAAKNKPAPWELQTTAQQLGHLARLQHPDPLSHPDIRAFFETLLPKCGDAVVSAVTGTVGLALSGGGFRASFYHLGVLAHLAELDVLRHVEVLSCVSGGSIVGAAYWLSLRRRLLDPKPMQHADYVELVRDLIAHFRTAVATDLRGQLQPGKLALIKRFLSEDEKGALDPESAAIGLSQGFYEPLLGTQGPVYMHDLSFVPADHQAVAEEEFNPSRDNWLRANKVPVLVINATAVNTGHAWQFTPTWMGESPWAIHEAADSIPRLEWGYYAKESGWQMELGRAVAASACVPGIFAPLRIDDAYPGIQVQLVDGGVHDNQGTVSLLAHNCNLVLVSDACGQLMFEDAPQAGVQGLANYAKRAMDTLMERVRLANFADLSARQRSGTLRGLLFLHMKAGLDADPIRRTNATDSYTLHRTTLTPSGVRRDFQQALAELRTDLNAFTDEECDGLMACGYQMSSHAFKHDLSQVKGLSTAPAKGDWPFQDILEEITSIAEKTPLRDGLLARLREGRKVKL
jgi:predicted acylesterase/phospholipase RssA